MYDNTRAALGDEGPNRSRLFERLTAAEQSDVLGFLAWFRTTGVEKSSVPSYKTYVCKGILKDDGREPGELTRSEKSGMKKFIYWLDNIKEA